MNSWVYLIVAIVAEVIATSFLKAADGFRNLWPSIIVLLGYGAAFYFLSLTLRTIPVGVSYAVWSGIGTTLIVVIGFIAYKQQLNIPTLVGIALIIAGVILINLFSKSIKS